MMKARINKKVHELQNISTNTNEEYFAHCNVIRYDY